MKAYAIIPLALQWLAYGPAILVFKTLCNFTVVGAEHLTGLSQAIFACNHAGELDPIVITAAVLPRGFTPMFYVGSPDKEFNDSFFSWRRFLYKKWFFRSWGSYPLVRGAQDYAVSLATHVQIVNDGHNMCIFPEGGVSTTGEIREGKGGVGYLLHATKVPVVPVYIADTGRKSSSPILSGRKRIRVVFGAPMNPDVLGANPTIESYKQVAGSVMAAIRTLASS